MPGNEQPVRSCIGCGRHDAKERLLRLALDPDGAPRVDFARTLPGRGGYLCGAGCLKAAMKKKALGRAFRGKARMGTEDVARLWIELGGAVGEWDAGKSDRQVNPRGAK